MQLNEVESTIKLYGITILNITKHLEHIEDKMKTFAENQITMMNHINTISDNIDRVEAECSKKRKLKKDKN
jgi:hypothetical protein